MNQEIIDDMMWRVLHGKDLTDASKKKMHKLSKSECKELSRKLSGHLFNMVTTIERMEGGSNLEQIRAVEKLKLRLAKDKQYLDYLTSIS